LLQKEIAQLTEEAALPNFWAHVETATQKSTRKANLEKEVHRWAHIEKKVEDLELMIALLTEEADASMEREAAIGIAALQKEIESLYIETLLSGKKDFNNAIVTIHPGAGGVESQDWAEMLSRMYLRWAERKGYRLEMIDLQPGGEAGIKSITFSANGPYAYGYLKSESGVHRLVRISPFDANKRRHTSFASVYVSPEIEDDAEIVIQDKEIRIDTYRASSAGGQNVNKTSSAIRITHFPSGIVVQCQNERSQLQNKAVAMKVLKSRLYELQQAEKEKNIAKLMSEKKEITWGSQIRSYVLQPYQLVKDHRTQIEQGNVTAIFDGEIDPFIEGFLKREKRMKETG